MTSQLAEKLKSSISFDLSSGLAKKRLAGIVIFAIILTLFFVFNRFPKLDIVEGDLESITGPVIECFQGFCIESDPDTSFVSRWVDFSVTYLRLVTIGMTFAFLVASLVESFLLPPGSRPWSGGGLFGRTLKGALLGPLMNLCSACIVPVSTSVNKRGAGIEGTIALVQGSSTMSVPALLMASLVFAPLLGISRIVISILSTLLIGPAVYLIDRIGKSNTNKADEEPDTNFITITDSQSWKDALTEAFRDWAKSSCIYLIKLGPIMAIAGFGSGLVIQWISPEVIDTYFGNHVTGVVIASTLGILINVPLMFEIPLVALLLLLGMEVAPAAALLFTAAAGGPVTFWGLSRILGRRALVSFVSITWIFGFIGGLLVLLIALNVPSLDWGFRPTTTAAEYRAAERTYGPLWDAIEENVD
ncbi:MAG: permease [Chloroflexota bacterium]|jgi:uncharacterized membrane protein YraQ (UPF0718 family)|tara:strand:- start:757 stop:2007 length:1251 start_codon:yes stop_codon:yes gene_type:complete